MMNVLKTYKTLPKEIVSASNLQYNQPLIVCEKFIPQNGPSTQLMVASSYIEMGDTTIVAEELSYILSYQTLSMGNS